MTKKICDQKIFFAWNYLKSRKKIEKKNKFEKKFSSHFFDFQIAITFESKVLDP